MGDTLLLRLLLLLVSGAGALAFEMAAVRAFSSMSSMQSARLSIAMSAPPETGTTYRSAGVDAAAADAALARIAARVRKTWPPAGAPGAVALDLGHFATVIDVGGGTGLALCTDGVLRSARIRFR